MSLRDELLTKAELKQETVHLPDFDKDIVIKAVHGDIRDEYELELAQQDLKPYRSMWIAMCAYDMEGNKIFNAKDVITISQCWTARDVNKAFNKCAELNGLSEEEKEKLKNE